MDNNAFSDDLLRENYAWVDELLEKKYYEYINYEENVFLNLKTFSPNDEYENYNDKCDSDFDLLLRDLKIILSYHEDRRHRRKNQSDDVFDVFNMLNPNY